MIDLPFKTRKLKGSVKRAREKVEDLDPSQRDVVIYGVTQREGLTVTGNKVSADTSKYIVVRGRSLAYNPYRVNVGSLGLSAESFFGAVSPAYVVFQTAADVDAHFLHFYLRSRLGQQLVRWYGDRGGVRSALRFEDLEQIDFPDIDVEEQRRVLAVVRRVAEAEREIEVQLAAQLADLDALRQRILDDAVRGRLTERDPDDESAEVLLSQIVDEKKRRYAAGEIRKPKNLEPISSEEQDYSLPEGWIWQRLGTVAHDTQGGWSPRCESRRANLGEWGVLKVSSVSQGRFVRSENKALPKGEDPRPEIAVRAGDFLVSRANTAELVARSAVVKRDPGNLMMSDKLVRIDFGGGVLPEYAHILNSSTNSREYYAANATGTSSSMKNVSRATIARLPFPLPPKAVQIRIVERVDALLALCDRLGERLAAARADAERLAQTVLADALTA